MRKRIIIVTLLSLLLLIPALTACSSGEPAESAANTPFNQLQNRVVALESRVASLDSTSLQPAVTQLRTDLDALSVQIAALQVQLDTLEGLVGEAEEENSTDGHSSDYESTIWTPYVYWEGVDEEDIIETHSVFPTARIDEEDEYRITIELENQTEGELEVDFLYLVLLPRSNAEVLVSTDTYVDSLDFPFLIWSTDIVERKDGTCRRIVGTCEGFTIDAGIGETKTLRVELSLLYQ